MFLNKAITKRLMKKAAKSDCLKVGRLFDGDYVVAGASWTINVDRDTMPNWFKAVIVEYAGELPEEMGELWEVFESDKQSTLLTEFYDLNRYKGMPYIVTPVIYDKNTRIVQDMTTHKYAGMLQFCMDWIDLSEIDQSMEGSVLGPNVTDTGFYVWYSGTMRLAVMAGVKTDKFQDILDAFEGIVFAERSVR
nr:MAG TPA: hypothetical protein [Caudoviricetes sp.]